MGKRMSVVEKREAAMKEYRMNRAVIEFSIPMMSIPKLYKAMEAKLAEGADDAALVAVVAAWPGVKKS